MKKKKYYFGLILLLFSFSTTGEEVKYKFHWSIVPVGELSININDHAPSDSNQNIGTVFDFFTSGPLKFLRNYHSTIFINQNKNNRWEYHLIGVDRGKPEEKLISYSSTSYPIVHTFIDDEGAEPLKTDELKDLRLIDPVSVLLNTIQRLNESKTCSNEFLVFDGKRRYKVAVLHIDNENLSADRFWTYSGPATHCQMKLFGDKLFEKSKIEFLEEVGNPTTGLPIGPTLDAKYRIFNNNQWPFNGEERVIDIWFSSEKEHMPVRFAIITPIGKIIGRKVSNTDK